MSNSLLPLSTLAGTIKAHIAAGDKAFGKAEEHYKAAGIHLIEARDRVKREGMTFSAFIVGHCNLGRSRAYELIAIADGTKTLEEVRSGTSARAARHADENRRAREASVNNGQPDQLSLLPQDERSEIERLKKQLIKAKQDAEEKEEQRQAQEHRANIAVKQVDSATNRAMYAEADRERLQAEVDRLTEENKQLRYVFGELMEEVENYFGHKNPSKFLEKHYPLFTRIIDDAEKRCNEAYPMDDDGNVLDTDYVEPERDKLVNTLCDLYPLEPAGEHRDDASDNPPQPYDEGEVAPSDGDDVEWTPYRNLPLEERIKISVAEGYRAAARGHFDDTGMDEPIHELNCVDTMVMAEMFGRRIAEHRIQQSAAAA